MPEKQTTEKSVLKYAETSIIIHLQSVPIYFLAFYSFLARFFNVKSLYLSFLN